MTRDQTTRLLTFRLLARSAQVLPYDNVQRDLSTQHYTIGFFLSLNKNKHIYQFQSFFRPPFWVPISDLWVELDLNFLILTNTLVYIGDQN